MGSSAGGVFLPNDPPPSTGQVLTNATLINPTITGGTSGSTFVNPSITGAVITGTVTIATGATITNPAIVGATVTGVVTIASGATLTTPAVSGATITGVVTVASGATITTPTILTTAGQITATGATGGAGTALSVVVPGAFALTGASGSAIDIATGAGLAGAFYYLRNVNATGVITVFAVGGTINGITGVTGVALSPTGTKAAVFACTVAGQWQIMGTSAT